MRRTFILSVAPVMNMYEVSVRDLVQRSRTDRSKGDRSRTDRSQGDRSLICPFCRLDCKIMNINNTITKNRIK